jgi:type II secretory pathway pseudopilin PulG
MRYIVSRSTKGHSLLETLVVVAVLIILIMIAIPGFDQARLRSKIAASRMDMRSLAVALDCYRSDYGQLPPAQKSDTSYLNARFLTSPIAFVASVPNDTFFTHTPSSISSEVGMAQVRPMKPTLPFYGYWTNASPYAVSREADLLYILIGRGPDGILGPGIQSVPYDPSNGLNSEGDLILKEPGFELDH